MPQPLRSRRPIIAPGTPAPSLALKAAALLLTLIALTAVVTPALADGGPTPTELARVEEAPRGTGLAR